MAVCAVLCCAGHPGGVDTFHPSCTAAQANARYKRWNTAVLRSLQLASLADDPEDECEPGPAAAGLQQQHATAAPEAGAAATGVLAKPAAAAAEPAGPLEHDDV